MNGLSATKLQPSAESLFKCASILLAFIPAVQHMNQSHITLYSSDIAISQRYTIGLGYSTPDDLPVRLGSSMPVCATAKVYAVTEKTLALSAMRRTDKPRSSRRAARTAWNSFKRPFPQVFLRVVCGERNLADHSETAQFRRDWTSTCVTLLASKRIVTDP